MWNLVYYAFKSFIENCNYGKPQSNHNISWPLDVTTIMKLFNHDARKISRQQTFNTWIKYKVKDRSLSLLSNKI